MNNNSIIIQQDAVYKTEKGTPVTDSLKVAQVFGKEHKNIIRAIRTLLGSAQNCAHRRWFCESTYTDTQGKSRPMFLMNRDGFSLLAMGLTGAKAMQFKVAFIEQFNAMERVVKAVQSPTPAIPQTFAEALRLAASQAEQIERQQRQIEADAPPCPVLTGCRDGKTIRAYRRTCQNHLPEWSADGRKAAFSMDA